MMGELIEKWNSGTHEDEDWGCFAKIRIYEEYVIKKVREPAYNLFAHWAQTQKSEHLPTFLGCEVGETGERGTPVFWKMEKLLLHRRFNWPDWSSLELLRESLGESSFSEGFISTISNVWDAFNEECEAKLFYWDLHSGNVMQREDGIAVITDPLATNDNVLQLQCNDLMEPLLKILKKSA